MRFAAVLVSMTGHGEAQCREGALLVAAELRTVNNRYFKLSLRASEGYGSLEPRIETLVRQRIRRGTVYATLRIERMAAPDDFRLNAVALRSYRQQLAAIEGQSEDRIPWEALLQLPGVVDESALLGRDTESVWPLVERTVNEAVDRLDTMRIEEGAAMAVDLQSNRQLILNHLQRVNDRAPLVVDAYRGRLTERLNKLLAEHGVTISAADVVREVGIFAERSDVAEEIVRLRSHLEQFDAILKSDESNGRKLEFLTQEMFRETNTIGSKCNDAEISMHVIDMKASIERIREMIQNVE